MTIHYLCAGANGALEYHLYPVQDMKNELIVFLSSLVEDDDKSFKSMKKAFEEKYVSHYHRTGYTYGIEKGTYTWYDKYGKAHEESYSFTREIGTVSYSEIQRGAIVPKLYETDEFNWIYPKKRYRLTPKEEHQLKRRYAESIIDSIQATNYELALKTLKNTVDLIAYSHSYRGYNTVYYKEFCKNISIRLDSNFGYGSVSYFKIVVKYKGITIIPYHRLFWYRYVKSFRLVNATDDFRCVDESWPEAFRRIIYYSELISAGETMVYDKLVVDSLKEMMNNLRRLVNDPDSFLRVINNTYHNHSDLYDYKIEDCVRTKIFVANEEEIVQSIVYEKICIVIDFITNIEEFNTVEGRLNEYISEIKSIILTQINPLKYLIASIGNSIHFMETNLEKEKESLNEIIMEMNVSDKTPSLKNKFNNKKESIKNNEVSIKKRNAFLKLLTDYLSKMQEAIKTPCSSA